MPNSIAFNTADGLNDIYRRPGGLLKHKGYEAMVHRAPNSFTMRGGKDHLRRRRILGEGLSDKSLRVYEPRMLEHINKFCDIIAGTVDQDGWSSPKDMASYCNYLSFDVMSDIVFGAKYNLLEIDRFRYVCKVIEKSNERMNVLVHAGRWASLKLLDRFLFRRAIFARNRFIRFVTRLVGDRISKSKSVHPLESMDVFSHLQEAKDPSTGHSLSANEITAESTTLIVAGSDSTSTSITSVLFYLSHYPEVCDRVTAEIRNNFTHANEICIGATLFSCRYFSACINEAFRMSPAAGSCLFRELPNHGAVIDGETLPGGSNVGVGIYSIHHNPTYFPDPFTYRPERWIVGLDDATQGSLEKGLSVLNPFSVGSRSCVGKSLAMMELQLTLASVLHRYDIKLAEGDLGRIGEGRADWEYGRHREHEYQLYEYITSSKMGPYLQFRARKDQP
jgi:cytochrome P450